MKYVIASDIHGSALFCSQLLDAYKREDAEKLVLLGDVLYHGPRNDLPEGYAPKQVIQMLNEISAEILCVRGNCDAEVDQMVLDFSITDDYKLLADQGRKIYITHGHHIADGVVPSVAGDVVFYGHTHVPVCEETDGVVYINPGSVSIPKENSQRGYILLDGNIAIHKNLAGEVIDKYEI